MVVRARKEVNDNKETMSQTQDKELSDTIRSNSSRTRFLRRNLTEYQVVNRIFNRQYR